MSYTLCISPFKCPKSASLTKAKSVLCSNSSSKWRIAFIRPVNSSFSSKLGLFIKLIINFWCYNKITCDFTILPGGVIQEDSENKTLDVKIKRVKKVKLKVIN